jgi:hypothetical protein
MCTRTEDVEENGKITAYHISRDGSLGQLGKVDVGGIQFNSHGVFSKQVSQK